MLEKCTEMASDIKDIEVLFKIGDALKNVQRRLAGLISVYILQCKKINETVLILTKKGY